VPSATALLFDERECGAATDRVLAHSSLSSDPSVSEAGIQTLAIVQEQQPAASAPA
jgi:hypothetical protein